MTKNKKKTWKKGPTEDLIPGQGKDINLMFYRDYMTDYFDIKVTNLGLLITDAKSYIETNKEKVVEIGKLQFRDEFPSEEQLVKYAKCEVVSTYYHCLETFMRLFISHALLTECPLMDLVAMPTRDFRHKYLERIAKGEFNFFNDKFSGDETILSVLTGYDDFKKCPIKQTEFDNLKEWIIILANDLLKMNEYNSHKHGLAMFVGKGGFKMTAQNGEELAKEGDSVYILESIETKDRYEFNTRNIFVEYDFKIAQIKFISELIHNIIEIGKMFYVTKKNPNLKGMHFTVISFWDLRDEFYTKGDIGSLMSSYGQGFHYYTDEISEMPTETESKE